MPKLELTGGEEPLHLGISVSNLQSAPLGIADDVVASIEIGWRPVGQEDFKVAFLEVRFVYVGPQQTTVVELFRVRRGLSFFARLEWIRYQDIYGRQEADTHGALHLIYDTGVVTNERSAIRERGSKAYRWDEDQAQV